MKSHLREARKRRTDEKQVPSPGLSIAVLRDVHRPTPASGRGRGRRARAAYNPLGRAFPPDVAAVHEISTF